MGTPINSMIAGFVATLTLSIMMIAKSMMGLMPELNVIVMLSSMMDRSLAIGWMAHFVIGTVVWGSAFTLLHSYLPGKTNIFTGISFGVAAWLLMMLVIMPIAGAGVFGLSLGMMAPLMTLILHGVYGAVLALTFRLLDRPEAAELANHISA